MNNLGVISMGIKCPIIKEGDNLVDIVFKSVLDATKSGVLMEDSRALGKEVNTYNIKDGDIIGITESIVARSAGLYVTLDEITDDIKKKLNNPKTIVVIEPIYSRNRFSMILKAIARAASEKVIIFMPDYDEVGNPNGVNMFTGVNMIDYYTKLVEQEGKTCVIHKQSFTAAEQYIYGSYYPFIYCWLHDYDKYQGTYLTLADICNDKNPDFGLLGTNKATEEKLKLFPTKELATNICEEIKEKIYKETGKNVYVCVYGDGAFKDPVGGIWEFADPVTMPGYSDADLFESTPNEIKIKAFADDQYKELNGKALDNAIKKEIKNSNKSLVGNMASQGTTPRLYRDLIASLMDLTSGSGSKGTPVILIQNYFNTYAD